ncbi:2-dehydro-3-deoxyphosphogluconate aldolase / (4S)-4-hydroxy-2-oxoglutarate aldolase [Tessaracoccus bendigoensis DSM 12906]|uniref:2-dehydro-3-deoxyphosphogluconate aldolase / (4S)-4-hydroxy-2-oxoglutarate aldolase n=1 Tax=Tessaracoccus bendigoensis DSM 12906 TaxID=1123357 RepID=A0A1M6P789_9ACTN|nr:hypothetical protein [Tessaracoccus bendigoensis]SHK03814.1 2-dehydro-3-deoxyphosphogluconate aldolase / (4S)-4-hydroxy-2-oxoglutarate aldolase [Tessaracoccus bendigoensis DSM 12906]
MTSKPTPSGIIVCLPQAELDDYVGVVETLIQEGFHNFALHASAECAAEVIAIFRSRATFGSYRASTVDQVATASEAGASFVLLDAPDDVVIGSALDLSLACFAAAMTPTEVRAVLATGATGALLFPADVVGHALGHRLAEVGIADRVIPLGGIGAYAAGEWFKAGAPAVCIEATLLGDAFTGGSLTQLRDRSGSFISVQKKQFPDS